ncbi:MAG TPA: hypothetical protein VF212_17635 [Longimicrobiales bacterium]
MAPRKRKRDSGSARKRSPGAARGKARDGGRAGAGGAARGASRGQARGGTRGPAAGRTRAATRERAADRQPATHLAVGYTDRRELDRFIEGEAGDVVLHGPIHTGRSVADAATLGAGATRGTPCLVIPLIRERMDEIQRELMETLERYQAGGAVGRGGARPRTIAETGGSARGTSAGAVRLGARREETA